MFYRTRPFGRRCRAYYPRCKALVPARARPIYSWARAGPVRLAATVRFDFLIDCLLSPNLRLQSFHRKFPNRLIPITIKKRQGEHHVPPKSELLRINPLQTNRRNSPRCSPPALPPLLPRHAGGPQNHAHVSAMPARQAPLLESPVAVQRPSALAAP